MKGKRDPPFRPDVPEDAAKQKLLELMEMCWVEDDHARPGFRTIRHKMKKITEYCVFRYSIGYYVSSIDIKKLFSPHLHI